MCWLVHCIYSYCFIQVYIFKKNLLLLYFSIYHMDLCLHTWTHVITNDSICLFHVLYPYNFLINTVLPQWSCLQKHKWLCHDPKSAASRIGYSLKLSLRPLFDFLKEKKLKNILTDHTKIQVTTTNSKSFCR